MTNDQTTQQRKQARRTLKLAFYLPNLAGGGAERVTLTLCHALAQRGHEVHLVLDERTGRYDIADERLVSVHELIRPESRGRRAIRMAANWRRIPALLPPVTASRKPVFSWPRINGLVDYLERETPDVLVSTLGYTPFIAHWALRMSGSATRHVQVEHNTPSQAFYASGLALRSLVRLNQLKNLTQTIYPTIDRLVAVSKGVAEDMAMFARVEASQIIAIPNPTSASAVRRAAAEAPPHPWAAQSAQPLLIAVGRLVPQKNYTLLINSMARLKSSNARLLVIGEGYLEASLREQIDRLGLSDRVDLIGWQNNPHAYMGRADVFVQSSDREGLSTVLIEALACGCRIVATDCKSGPREILEDGRFGAIVPMHDSKTLAAAIDRYVEVPEWDRKPIMQAAERFSVDSATSAYEDLFQELISRTCRHEI